MFGLMQQHELLISGLIEFAQSNHADTEIISRRVEGDIHRSNWAQVAKRAKQIANALKHMDLAVGSDTALAMALAVALAMALALAAALAFPAA